jgi:pimeloyl-ACP methyl ester carboxylesterase
MARDALFLDALDLGRADILGFSLGSFVAQEIALTRPTAVRRLILASSAPQGAAGMHGWAPEVIDAVGQPKPNPAGVLDVFFARSETSRKAGRQAFGRMGTRTVDRDRVTTWQPGWPSTSAHGFLFQHHAEFAADVDTFLTELRK